MCKNYANRCRMCFEKAVNLEKASIFLRLKFAKKDINKIDKMYCNKFVIIVTTQSKLIIEVN